LIPMVGADAECDAVLLNCLWRIRRWRVPPSWSARDWFEEIAAELAFAALQAARVFDPARGVRREVFLQQRIRHRAYNRYRREWIYAIRQVARAELDRPAESDGRGRPSREAEVERLRDFELLQDALGRLPRPDFCLIEGLFWGGKTECELAKALGVSQQAVSKRKRMIVAVHVVV
jgi:RNA polymerase sigma factor (sigma-70 family)